MAKFSSTTTISDLPNRRYHTSIVYNDFLYVFGGTDGENVLNDLFTINLDTLNTLEYKRIHCKLKPPARFSHTWTQLDNTFILYGGFSKGKMLPLNDIWIFTPLSNTWRQILIGGNA